MEGTANFLAMGFSGPESLLIDQLDLITDQKNNIKADFGVHQTNVKKKFLLRVIVAAVNP